MVLTLVCTTTFRWEVSQSVCCCGQYGFVHTDVHTYRQGTSLSEFTLVLGYLALTTDKNVSISCSRCPLRDTIRHNTHHRGPLPVNTVTVSSASLNVTLAESNAQDSEYTRLGCLKMPCVLTQPSHRRTQRARCFHDEVSLQVTTVPWPLLLSHDPFAVPASHS